MTLSQNFLTVFLLSAFCSSQNLNLANNTSILLLLLSSLNLASGEEILAHKVHCVEKHAYHRGPHYGRSEYFGYDEHHCR